MAIYGNFNMPESVGTWEICDNTLILCDQNYGQINRFKIEGDNLIFISQESDNFTRLTLQDGTRFYGRKLIDHNSLSYIQSIPINDIDTVTLSAYPPEKSVDLTKDQIDKLLSLLGDINLYEKDNSYNEYNGQWVQFDITLKSVEKISIAEFNPFFIINRTGYRAEYEPCQALNVFANSIIAE